MTVRCAHCGEELLGAVNRCWKCGQQFVARPTIDGLPPVRIETPAAAAVVSTAGSEPLEARVLDDLPSAALTETTVLVIGDRPPAATQEAPPAGALPTAIAVSESPPQSIFPPPPNPLSTPSPYKPPLTFPAMHRYVPPRPNIAALGGAYSALLLGIFALCLAPFRWEAAIVAFVGLLAGIWGIYSPRRGWALVGMLLCALAMGWGTFTGVRALWLYMNRYAPIVEETPEEDEAITP
jgi:hypothetical protein